MSGEQTCPERSFACRGVAQPNIQPFLARYYPSLWRAPCWRLMAPCEARTEARRLPAGEVESKLLTTVLRASKDSCVRGFGIRLC